VRWGRWLLGLGLLAVLIRVAGPSQLAATFSQIDLGRAVEAVALSVLWLLLGACNVWILLRLVAPVPLSTFVPIYGTSWAASYLLPGQLGDATQVLLLRHHDVPVSRSGAVYLLDKAISLTWLFVVAAYGIGLYIPGIRGWWLALLPLGALIVSVGCVAILLRMRAREGGLLARLQGLVTSTLAELQGMMRHHGGALALNGTLTVVKWLINASYYWVTFRAFGFEVSFEAAATLPVMSSLVGYLPITVGGAGTTEWTATFLFARVGATAATVVSAYLFLRVLHLSIALLLTALPQRAAAGASGRS